MTLPKDVFQISQRLGWSNRKKDKSKFLKDKRYWEGYADALKWVVAPE